MNTSGFQCSIFIGVMMAMAVYSDAVYNHPLGKDKLEIMLLRNIKNATRHLLKEDLHGWVPKVYNESCKPRFFCLARKVVKTNLTQPKFRELKKALNEYNKTIMTHCQLDNVLEDYLLKEFIRNVKTCVKRLLNRTS